MPRSQFTIQLRSTTMFCGRVGHRFQKWTACSAIPGSPAGVRIEGRNVQHIRPVG